MIVRDELSGREVVYAPGRARRPGAARGTLDPPSERELADCPFCAGHEERTPPEVHREGDPWLVRVVPNLYPAFERQEVVVSSPRHVRSFAELTGAGISNPSSNAPPAHPPRPQEACTPSPDPASLTLKLAMGE